MKRFLLIIISLLSINFYGQNSIDKVLKKSLDSIMVLDQKYRAILDVKWNLRRKHLAHKCHISISNFEKDFWKIQNKVDSTNLIFVENILKTRGYPGLKLVGKRTNGVAWYVIQHSNKIGEYIELIKNAAKERQLSRFYVAMMEDRYLMDQGKEQIYGTQGWSKDGLEWIIWPIKDAENINKTRKEFGYKKTIERYAKSLDITYRVVKLSEVPK
jgi:uncharacterized protein DUF6624